MKTWRVAVFCAAVALAGAACAASPEKKGAPAVTGKMIFQRQCTVCHFADSTDRKMGPGLKGLFKRDKLVNGKKVTEANVRAKIAEGGNGMPAYKEMLGDQEMNELIAYLKTL